ncbi:hypothetical protein, partial [Nodularia sphaerocarpa]
MERLYKGFGKSIFKFGRCLVSAGASQFLRKLMKPHPNPLLVKEREPEWESDLGALPGRFRKLMKPHPNLLVAQEREPEWEFYLGALPGRFRKVMKPHPNPLVTKEREPEWESDLGALQ